MKIRWTRKSVRARISPSELDALLRGEALEEILSWGEVVSWSLSLFPLAPVTEIRLREGSVQISLSAEDGLRLAEPEAEGVYFQREGEPPLRYYIEKDFPCVHPRAIEANEPLQETFEAPEGFEERKADVTLACSPDPSREAPPLFQP